MEISIVVAIISLVGMIVVAFVNNTSIRALNKKLTDANAKKANAEADSIIFEFKNKTIKDLQDQINQLRVEIDQLKKQEHIHLQEKIRLEQQISDLKSKNERLITKLKASDVEINNLMKELNKLKLILGKLNYKN